MKNFLGVLSFCGIGMFLMLGVVAPALTQEGLALSFYTMFSGFIF